MAGSGIGSVERQAAAASVGEFGVEERKAGMRLTEEERAIDAGEQGLVRQWAIRHQIAVGEFFDAGDFVPVSLAHVRRLADGRPFPGRLPDNPHPHGR
jgi:Aconitase X